MTKRTHRLSNVTALLTATVLIPFSAIVSLSSYLADQDVRHFSSAAATILKNHICPHGYANAYPCGTKDVRQEADSGLIAYLYIYGVTEKNEIDELRKVIKTFRSNKPYYRKIPVKVIFFSDLRKLSAVKQFWILESNHAHE